MWWGQNRGWIDQIPSGDGTRFETGESAKSYDERLRKRSAVDLFDFFAINTRWENQGDLR